MTGGRATTWYEHAATAPPLHPPLRGPHEVEICVIGGGLAGLGAALSLAQRGRRVALLEAMRIGEGASGRNGGMVSAGFNRGLDDIARAAGQETAEALYRLSLDAVRLLRRRIEEEAIDCGLVEGVIEASWFDDEAVIRHEVLRMNGLGARLEAWSGERLRLAYRSQRFRGGFRDRDGFHLDPLALCRGLARAAAKAGVTIHEGTPAHALSGQGPWMVTTPQGSIRAERIVVCTSAGRPGLAPQLHRGTLPVLSHIVVTEPLGQRLTDAIRAPHAVYDDRMATGYFRPLPEGRLLWGGRVDALGPPRRLEQAMRRDLARVFPQLAGVRFDFAWSGAMGFARHRMPVVRPLAPGLWVAVGFGGHGLNTTTLAGELVASAVSEGCERWRLLDAFGLPWNGGPFGPLAAQLFYRAFQARDAITELTAPWRRSG